VKTANIISGLTAALFLTLSCIAYGDNKLSYDKTVQLISKTMADNTSAARQESYGYIKIDGCKLEYQVSGAYPVGTLYDIKFSNIDFSSLNKQQSKVGRDYTDFILLNFENQAKYRLNGVDKSVQTVVINSSDAESAKILFQAFLHLGELCGAFREDSAVLRRSE